MTTIPPEEDNQFVELGIYRKTSDWLARGENGEVDATDLPQPGAGQAMILAVDLTESVQHVQEIMLNKGCDRETILASGACEMVESTEMSQSAFAKLRYGYPDMPYEEQCHGEAFRKAADVITEALAEHTLRGLDPEKMVVMMPWRAGLAFGESYKKQGVRNFYHVGSRRDENTQETIVDYESGSVEEGDSVIIADPMLATGNTAIDAIERLLKKGVTPERIIVNAVVAAPVGIDAIKSKYPMIRVIVGAVDEKLDCRAYIVEGLGDFGDKYCGDLTRQEVNAIADSLGLSAIDRKHLLKRFGMLME